MAVTGTIPNQTADGTSTATRDGACALVETQLNAAATDGITYTVAASWTGQSSAYGSEVAGDVRTEVPGSRQIAPGAQVVSFSNVDASGASHLTRNGKSPNIFALDAVAHTVTYDNSTYDYTGTFNITTTFSYACSATQHIPAVQGTTRLETQGECADRVTHDPDLGPHVIPGQYCLDLSHRLNVTVPGTPAQDNADPEDSTTGTVDQAGTATGGDTELNGGQYTFQNQSLPVAAVVCISPTKNPGTWRAANNYAGLGGTCGYTLFQSLGTSTIPSNSLPYTG